MIADFLPDDEPVAQELNGDVPAQRPGKDAEREHLWERDGSEIGTKRGLHSEEYILADEVVEIMSSNSRDIGGIR
jgi:hypothetical protein